MNKQTPHQSLPSRPVDDDPVLDDLQTLWERRTRRLDAILSAHAAPLPSTAALAHWTHRRQQRSDLLRYAAACLFLFLLLPASLSAKETSVRYSPDSSYDYMASITNLDTSVRAL